MRYPSLLKPQSVEEILLPSGDAVEVPKVLPIFKEWRGDHIGDTYGGKTILNFDGEPTFAELAILRAFQNSGWDGVWIDTFGRKYRVGYWGENVIVDLPYEQLALLERIAKRVGTSSGCWDVFCWANDLCLFAEAKQQDCDKIRDTQCRWLEAAIIEGLPLSSFLVVEWSVQKL